MKQRHFTFAVLEKPEPDFKPGVHSYVSVEDEMLKSMYNRQDNKRRLGLKIFKNEFKPIDKFKWKNHNLLECTKIQNIYAMHGIAPRIFDLVKIQFSHDKDAPKHWAQVTEIVEDDERGKPEKEVGKLFNELRKKYGIKLDSVDPNPNHKYKKMYVDFSHMSFDGDKYKRFLTKLYKDNVNWGSNPLPYQSVPELNIEGQRNLDKRLETYDWDEEDFTGSTVLFYGASGGSMCRYMVDLGASRVVGLDTPKVCLGANHLNNYLGYFNVDMIGGNFSHKGDRSVYGQIIHDTGLEKFDWIMYLSCQQLGMPDYLDKICKKGFYLEGHSGDHDYTYRDDLRKEFKEVIFLGGTKDHGVRPVFKCLNPK